MADVASQAGENEFDVMPLKDFNSRLQSDVELNTRYRTSPQSPEFAKINERLNEAFSTLLPKYGEKWIEHLDESTPAEGTPASQGQAQQIPQGAAAGSSVDVSSLADDAEIEVSVKIPKNLFGTYLKNRTPDQAVIEALKGNREKDATINVLRDQHSTTHEENISLRSKVRAAMEQMTQSSSAQPPQEVISAAAMDVGAIDFLDPEDQEKFTKNSKVLVEFVKKAQTAQPNVELQAKTKEELAKLERSTEFAEIRQLQVTDPSLSTSVDFETLDRSVSSFYEGLKMVSRLPSVEDAWALYNDPVKGEQLRSQCVASGVVMPAEINQHLKIMHARSQILKEIDTERKSKAEEMTQALRNMGKNETIDVSAVPRPSYASIWKRVSAGNQPAVVVAPPVVPPAAAPQAMINPALQQQIEARREQSTQQTVPLVPPGAAGPVADARDIPRPLFEEINDRFVKNPSALTKDEAQLLARVYEWQQVPMPAELKRRL